MNQMLDNEENCSFNDICKWMLDSEGLRSPVCNCVQSNPQHPRLSFSYQLKHTISSSTISMTRHQSRNEGGGSGGADVRIKDRWRTPTTSISNPDPPPFAGFFSVFGDVRARS